MSQSRGEDKPLAQQPQVPRQSRDNAGSEDQRSKQGANLQPDSSGSSVDEARRDRPTSHPPPELDFYSWHFNALAALYTPGLMPPMKVKPLDNVSRARVLLPPEMPESTAAEAGRRAPRSTESIAAQERAKARGASIQHRQLQKVEDYNPLQEIMNKIKAESPLAMLCAVAERHGRLRVVTRHSCGVRGVAVGSLQAFDKFLNLLMKDVDEDYVVSVRVSRTKVVTLPPHEKRPPALVDQDCDAEELAEELQKVRVRWRPKQEKRKRHLKQILIRGDSVVMVSPVE